jgi:hypothetical protein
MEIGTWIQVVDEQFPEYNGKIGVVFEVFTHTVTAEFDGDRVMILLKRQVREATEMSESEEEVESIRPSNYDPYDDPEFSNYQKPDAAGNVPKDMNFYDASKRAEVEMIDIKNALDVLSDNIRKLWEQQKRSKTLANKFNLKQLREYFVKTYGENAGLAFDDSEYEYDGRKQKKRSKEKRVWETFEALVRMEQKILNELMEKQRVLRNLTSTIDWTIVDGTPDVLFESAINVYKAYLNEIRKLSEWIKLEEGKVVFLEERENVEEHIEILNNLSTFLSTHWDGYIPSRKAQNQKRDVEWALRQK